MKSAKTESFLFLILQEKMDLCKFFDIQMCIKDDEKPQNKCNNNIMESQDIEHKKIVTEDTGKMFEMAICKTYNIEFKGKYNYTYDLYEKLQSRLYKLHDLFPQCIHTADKGARYDFTAVANLEQHLSAKTVKKGGAKVAPQVIGQANPDKFCNIIGIPYISNFELKEYIQANIASILQLMTEYTFDCDNLYYHQQRNTLQYIKYKNNINWNNFEYIWSKDHKSWTNSSTCKLYDMNTKKYISIAEFQFHTKNRKNMAIRWCYDNVLKFFSAHFDIIHL